MVRLPQFCVAMLALALTVGLTTPVHADEAKGTIRTVKADKGEFVIKGVLNDTTYELAKGTIVFLDGKKSKLEDIQEGDRAVVLYSKVGDRMQATEVRCTRKATETTGTVRSVASDRNELIIKGVVKDSHYKLEKGATVWINGKMGQLADLREGDNVILTYETRGNDMILYDVRTNNTR